MKSFYAQKNTFVTGHTGFKGAWLSEWLLHWGAKVTGFSLDVPTTPSLFEILNHPGRLLHKEGDVRDYSKVLESLKTASPEIVFHLAAQPLVRQSYDDPKTTFETNVQGTINVLEAVREIPSVRAVVVVTSDKVYDNVGWEFGYRENDRLGGGDPYSVSKACAELVTASYHRAFFSSEESKVKIATVRAGNVIGGGDFAKDRIVPDCVRAWNENKVVLLRQPESIRPWQHVLEPLGGYLLVGKKLFEREPKVIGEAFNFGPPIESCKNVRDLVSELKLSWPQAQWEQTPHDPSRPESKHLRVNCEKAYQRLHWTPRLNFAETLKMTGDWYRIENKADLVAFTQKQIQNYSSLISEL